MKVIGVVIVNLIGKEFDFSVTEDPECYLILEARIVELIELTMAGQIIRFIRWCMAGQNHIVNTCEVIVAPGHNKLILFI